MYVCVCVCVCVVLDFVQASQLRQHTGLKYAHGTINKHPQTHMHTSLFSHSCMSTRHLFLSLEVHTRKRIENPPESDVWKVVEEQIILDPLKTALIIIDMWDLHPCLHFSNRSNELAPAIDRTVRIMRYACGFVGVY